MGYHWPFIFVLLLFPTLLAVLLQNKRIIDILLHITQGISGNTCLCFCCWRKQARSSGSSPFRVIMLSIWNTNRISKNPSRGYLDSRGCLYPIFLTLRSTSEMLGCLSLSCCTPRPLTSSSSAWAPCSWTKLFQKMNIRIVFEDFFKCFWGAFGVICTINM